MLEHRLGDLLQRFFDTSCAGWRAAISQPDEAATLIVAMNGGASQWATERAMLAVMTPYILGEVGLERFGELDRQRWVRNLTTYTRIGILSRPVALDEVVDDRFGFMPCIIPSKPRATISNITLDTATAISQ